MLLPVRMLLKLELTRMPEFGRWLLGLSVVIGLASEPLVAGGNSSVQNSAELPLVSLAFDLQPIFDTYCVQCHLLESAQGGLVLENGEAWGNLVNIDSTQAALKRVDPGNPGPSYLLHKLGGTHIQVGGTGQIMPFGVPAGIDDDSVELIARWISEGAADN